MQDSRRARAVEKDKQQSVQIEADIASTEGRQGRDQAARGPPKEPQARPPGARNAEPRDRTHSHPQSLSRVYGRNSERDDHRHLKRWWNNRFLNRLTIISISLDLYLSLIFESIFLFTEN